MAALLEQQFQVENGIILDASITIKLLLADEAGKYNMDQDGISMQLNEFTAVPSAVIEKVSEVAK
jgi:hypothetical protein